MAFDRAIAANNTSELAIDQDYTAVDGLCRQQVFACMVCICMVLVDSTGRTNGITLGFPTRSDTNWAVHPQKMARA